MPPSRLKMPRIVASLLICLVLSNQSYCAAHSHTGISIADPAGHSDNPHVHLHGGTHGDHPLHVEHKGKRAYERFASVVSKHRTADHDSDAVYVVESQFLNETKTTRVADLEFAFVGMVNEQLATAARSPRCTEGGLPPPPQTWIECPLYLRILSIRL